MFGDRNNERNDMPSQKSRAIQMFALVGWTYITIRTWCNATVDGFGGNAIFQVIVASLLLIVFQTAIVYGPSIEEEEEGKLRQDQESDGNNC